MFSKLLIWEPCKVMRQVPPTVHLIHNRKELIR